ncbi:MAG: 2TM domain-containing protein [Rhodothermaceae bacterium]|nr:2TM domain-containing protein [Rhodothermaceae bacterium]
MPLTEEEARERIETEKEFYGHLAIYLVVNMMLMALNLLTSPRDIWFIFPLMGWGIGLVAHATSVFGLPGMGRAWEDRRARELTGQDTEATSLERLRILLDEELDERAVPSATEQQSAERLQRRIEHLEAIVTSRDWEAMETPPPQAAPRLTLPDEGRDEEEAPEARAARLARRVR